MPPPSALLAIFFFGPACGGAATSPTEPEPARARPRRASSHPLAGRWWTDESPKGELPCRLEIELFDDGTAEANILFDDTPCAFFRIPYRHDPDRSPPRVGLAGELHSCVYRREGETLRLACSDHTAPPDDFEDALVLRPMEPSRPARGLRGIAGLWASQRILEDRVLLEIGEDGSVRLDEAEGRIEVHGTTLDLALGRRSERCLFAATERSLAIRCAPGAYPERIVDPAWPVRTLSFTRMPIPEGRQ